MNVEAGDLAYLAGGFFPESIGTVVDVIKFGGCDYFHPIGFADFWVCKTAGESMTDEGLMAAGTLVAIPDKDLRRIAGPSVIIETETDQPIEVMA